MDFSEKTPFSKRPLFPNPNEGAFSLNNLLLGTARPLDQRPSQRPQTLSEPLRPISENSSRLWLFPGSTRGLPRKLGKCRENCLGKTKWPLLCGHWKMAKKRSTKSTPVVFAPFRLLSTLFAIFLHFFARFRPFWAVCF